LSTEPFATYDDFADRVIASDIVTDPWIHGQPRLDHRPLFVTSAERDELYRAAERVATAYNDVCQLCVDEPQLLDDFFGLSPYQKAMWTSTQPFWHGIARADVFRTTEGLAFTEINSDTPTGEAEAVVLNEIVHPLYPDTVDPNAQMAERFCSMVEGLAQQMVVPDAPRVAGIVYPTEFTEDLALVRLYKKWFEARGWDVVLGSPYNLSLDSNGFAQLFDVPFSVMLRHYKTDWWGERASVWDDEGIPDEKPLAQPLGTTIAAMLQERLCVVNPFAAVVPQNKRAMALMWEHIHRFPEETQDTIRRFIPPTFRLEVMHEEQLFTEQAEWVLKSDYGAEGDEVIIGRLATDKVWRESIAHARPGRWVVQRYFETLVDDAGKSVNWGVFLVAGEGVGLYARMEKGPTTDAALSVPVFVRG